MADPNVTQEVWIEDLEKLADGSYKRKNYIAKAENGTTLSQHLADDNVIKHRAKQIALEDTTNKFTATNVETALAETMTRADEAFTSASNGKTLVSNAITGVDDSIVIPAEPSFADLASAIGQISTGKKWASGSTTIGAGSSVVVGGLGFTPKIILLEWAQSPYVIRLSYIASPLNNNLNTAGGHLWRTDNSTVSVWGTPDMTWFIDADGFTVMQTGGTRGRPVTWYAYE